MVNSNREGAEFYLSLINSQLKIKTSLGGEGGRDGIKDEELGGYVGDLMPNMSQLKSVIYTAHCLIQLRDKVQKYKLGSLETKAHYWEKFGKPAYEREQEKLKKRSHLS